MSAIKQIGRRVQKIRYNKKGHNTDTTDLSGRQSNLWVKKFGDSPGGIISVCCFCTFTQHYEPNNLPGGLFVRSLPEAREISDKVTTPTHGHWEGVKRAEATAVSIYHAKTGCDKEYIRSYVEENYYKLDFTIDGIRETYSFNRTFPGTVPEALEVFLESSSFEDCVRTAVSLGGDCDTVAAIASSVAEAFYGVPDEMKRKAETYMDGYTLNLFKDVEEGF